MPGPWDAIVIGAGPAGLTAALYLARFRRTTLALHDGTSRASQIPLSHNVPGWTSGVSGSDLLAKISAQAGAYGAAFSRVHVTAIRREEDTFAVEAETEELWRCRSLILATGAETNQLPLDPEEHERALQNRVLAYCPICDGFEHIAQNIAVVGCDQHGAQEALFMRHYSSRITLFPKSFSELNQQVTEQLSKAGVTVVNAPVESYVVRQRDILIRLAHGEEPRAFDVVYPALGIRPRSRLASMLGLPLTNDGSLEDSAPFRTAIPGLYAAGDIVAGLDQISVAMGQGAAAATRAHNWLRKAGCAA